MFGKKQISEAKASPKKAVMPAPEEEEEVTSSLETSEEVSAKGEDLDDSDNQPKEQIKKERALLKNS